METFSAADVVVAHPGFDVLLLSFLIWLAIGVRGGMALARVRSRHGSS